LSIGVVWRSAGKDRTGLALTHALTHSTHTHTDAMTYHLESTCNKVWRSHSLSSLLLVAGQASRTWARSPAHHTVTVETNGKHKDNGIVIEG
jgi:hypothetical protein